MGKAMRWYTVLQATVLPQYSSGRASWASATVLASQEALGAQPGDRGIRS
jgi:hypothetical protein